jgi:hypothetical protein
MKKETLVAQLEAAKALTSVVSIDNVIALIQQLEAEVRVEKVFGITQELAEEIANKIERCLDYNSNRLIDLDSAEFELTYNNVIELTNVDIDVREIMDHVTASLEGFVEEEDFEEEAELTCDPGCGCCDQIEAADSVSVSVINSEVLRQDETE